MEVSSPPSPRRWWHSLLRVSLLSKLLGSTLAVAVVSLFALFMVHGGEASSDWVLRLASGAILAAVIINAGLVIVALQPLRALERTVSRISAGDRGTRVAAEALSDDPELMRVGGTLNALLDALTTSEAKLRRLAQDAITVGDRERAEVAHQLHESSAQTLAGLRYELAALQRDLGEGEMAARVGHLERMTGEVLEQVRLLSETLHPQVLEERGLAAALAHLARRTGERSGVEIDVQTDGAPPRVPKTIAGVMYQVAREAVANALLHGAPRHIHLLLAARGPKVVLEVVDDGAGLDEQLAAVGPGQGLVRMKERMALVDGTFDVRREPSGGTRAIAAVALAEGAMA